MAERPVVHAVWIGGPLSVLEQLTLRLWVKRGLRPWLWSYAPCENVPAGVIGRDAAEIMPDDSLFSFQSERGFAPGQGKGSFSHWSDQFQLGLLLKYGGWYTQLDVSCLKLPDPVPEYYFFPFTFPGETEPGMQTCVMRLPAGSAFAAAALDELRAKVNKSTAATIDWFDSMRIVCRQAMQHDLGRYVAHPSTAIDFAAPGLMLNYLWPGPRAEFIHWSNAWSGPYKHTPIPGTYYETLLKSVGL